MIKETRESMRFAKQNSFQSYKAASTNDYLGSLLTKAYRSTEQHSAPILAIAKKFGATGLTPGHHLFAYMHSAQGRLSSPAPETHACAQYKVRVRPDAPWGRGAEALLSERLSSLC